MTLAIAGTKRGGSQMTISIMGSREHVAAAVARQSAVAMKAGLCLYLDETRYSNL